jgi:Salmonella virulence plasmid 65kDa B protein
MTMNLKLIDLLLPGASVCPRRPTLESFGDSRAPRRAAKTPTPANHSGLRRRSVAAWLGNYAVPSALRFSAERYSSMGAAERSCTTTRLRTTAASISCGRASGGSTRSANRYLRRIRWGNRTPQMLDPERPSFRPCHLDAPDPDATDWMFSAVLDYGEGRYEELPPDHEGRVRVRAHAAAQHAWRAHRDPFSSFAPSFNGLRGTN